MGKILSQHLAINTAKKIKKEGKTIVVAGGVFDVLHIGHLVFLTKAKKEGDFLFVLVEPDSSVRNNKGPNRPIYPQKERTTLLAGVIPVDFVVALKEMTKDIEYDTLMAEILPDIIATTKGDPNLHHKERQAKKIGATIKFVTKRIGNLSSSRFAKLLEQ